MYPCPCCGYEVFGQPPGSYEICPICSWEDDIVQLAFPDMAGGANRCSLIEGQKAFAKNGACESRFNEHVRVPEEEALRHPNWRSLDPRCDHYLKWDSQTDREKWQEVKDSPMTCLYYWSSEYWLAQTVAEQGEKREPE